jgi:hypothetical protein
MARYNPMSERLITTTAVHVEREDKPVKERKPRRKSESLPVAEQPYYASLKALLETDEPLKFCWLLFSIEPFGENGFLVPSCTNPEVWYVTSLDPKDCQCEGFYRHQTCYHITVCSRLTELKYAR